MWRPLAKNLLLFGGLKVVILLDFFACYKAGHNLYFSDSVEHTYAISAEKRSVLYVEAQSFLLS
jgi:hypothetical protein